MHIISPVPQEKNDTDDVQSFKFCIHVYERYVHFQVLLTGPVHWMEIRVTRDQIFGQVYILD
jgi:hypothetical protein